MADDRLEKMTALGIVGIWESTPTCQTTSRRATCRTTSRRATIFEAKFDAMVELVRQRQEKGGYRFSQRDDAVAKWVDTPTRIQTQPIV